jgi:hypothetical protein
LSTRDNNVNISTNGEAVEPLVENSCISTLLRGGRYVFTHKTIYSPLLDKYVKAYTKGSDEYYGYVETNYQSPNLIVNLIDNPEYSGTSSWTPVISNAS